MWRDSEKTVCGECVQTVGRDCPESMKRVFRLCGACVHTLRGEGV